MTHYTYLIIGGGMTADAAIRGIRELDAHGTIGLISAELDPPYNRPPLSKGLWQGKRLEKIWRRTEDQGVELHLGRTAQVLDPERKEVVDDQGKVYMFDKLLLATGSTPRHLPFGGDDIIYYRSLADYRHVRHMTEQGQRFAVIGGGFIGWEMAAALAMNGKDVVMLFPDKTIGQRIYPHDLGQFLNGFYREKGVEILTETVAVDLSLQGAQFVLKTKDVDNRHERDILADGVVAGIGVLPNVNLAEAAGLEIANGIIVDEYLRTSHRDVYAAGDVASFYSAALGKRLRFEHEDNANSMGRQAGRVMAGAHEPYHHHPFFYSDLFDLGYEAVGDVDARLETVADWKDPYREGVVYYLEAGRVRGVLLWNVWGQVEAARQLISEGSPPPTSKLQPQVQTTIEVSTGAEAG